MDAALQTVELQDQGQRLGMSGEFIEQLVRHYGYRIAQKLVQHKDKCRLPGVSNRPKVDRAAFLKALHGLALSMGDRADVTGEANDYKAENMLAGILKHPDLVDLFFEILIK